MFSFLDAFMSLFRKKQSVLPKVRTSPQPSPRSQENGPKPQNDFVPWIASRNWVIQTEVNGRFFVRSVWANTKSEARALVKREFGLSRLPVGTIIHRTGKAA